MVKLYRLRPTPENAVELYRSMREWTQAERVQNSGIFLACIRAIQHQIPDFYTWQLRLSCWLIKVGTSKARPTWNDFHIVYWVLTKDPASMAELHRRARHVAPEPPWVPMVESVRWATESLRQTDTEFANALAHAERMCRLCRSG